MSARTCAWCGDRMHADGDPASHGICAACLARLLAEADRDVASVSPTWKDWTAGLALAALMAVILFGCP